MASVGVAEIVVLDDDHVTIADFFEGTKAQVADVKLSNGNAAATPFPPKKGKQSIFALAKLSFYD